MAGGVGKDVIRNEQIRGSEDRKNMNDDTRTKDTPKRPEKITGCEEDFGKLFRLKTTELLARNACERKRASVKRALTKTCVVTRVNPVTTAILVRAQFSHAFGR